MSETPRKIFLHFNAFYRLISQTKLNVLGRHTTYILPIEQWEMGRPNSSECEPQRGHQQKKCWQTSPDQLPGHMWVVLRMGTQCAPGFLEWGVFKRLFKKYSRRGWLQRAVAYDAKKINSQAAQRCHHAFQPLFSSPGDKKTHHLKNCIITWGCHVSFLFHGETWTLSKNKNPTSNTQGVYPSEPHDKKRNMVCFDHGGWVTGPGCFSSCFVLWISACFQSTLRLVPCWIFYRCVCGWYHLLYGVLYPLFKTFVLFHWCGEYTAFLLTVFLHQKSEISSLRRVECLPCLWRSQTCVKPIHILGQG